MSNKKRKTARPGARKTQETDAAKQGQKEESGTVTSLEETAAAIADGAMPMTGGQAPPNSKANAQINSPTGTIFDVPPDGDLGAPAEAINAAVERVSLFGQVVWLMMQSQAHKSLFLSDMEWLVLPAIQSNQFRIWQQHGMPICYASWAWLDKDAEERMKQNIKKLSPSDWLKTSSEESLWLIDMIAPFGGMDEALKTIKDDVFEGRSIKMLQKAPSGGMAVVEW